MNLQNSEDISIEDLVTSWARRRLRENPPEAVSPPTYSEVVDWLFAGWLLSRGMLLPKDQPAEIDRNHPPAYDAPPIPSVVYLSNPAPSSDDSPAFPSNAAFGSALILAQPPAQIRRLRSPVRPRPQTSARAATNKLSPPTTRAKRSAGETFGEEDEEPHKRARR